MNAPAREMPAFCTRCGWSGRAANLAPCPDCDALVTRSAFDGVAEWEAKRQSPAEAFAELAAMLPPDTKFFCDDCGALLTRCECPDIHPEGT